MNIEIMEMVKEVFSQSRRCIQLLKGKEINDNGKEWREGEREGEEKEERIENKGNYGVYKEEQ